MAQSAIDASDTSTLRGKTIIGTGVVIDDPSSGGFLQNVLVRISECTGDDGCAGQRVLIAMDRWKEVSFGDTVRFSCLFERPENFSEEFDWRMYLASRNVRALCKKADVFSVIGSQTFLGSLGSVRRLLEESVNRAIEQPYSALGNGLLFGGSDRMSDELAQDFSKTSMTHITAVSGYNVSLIAGYIFLLAIYLGCWRKGATIVAIGGIVLFVLFIGSPSSAIRAGVMGSILLFALALGRSRESLRVLIYAGAIMIAMNPLILRHDVGFQLSFLATLGIVVMAPWYEKVRPKNTLAQGVTEIVFMTTSAQIFVLPVILFTFHSFSFLAIVVNLLVLWTIPFAMLFTFLTSLFGLVSGWLGFAVGIGAQGILWYDIVVVQWFARMDWSVVRIEAVGVWFFIVWYGLLGSLAYWVYWREWEEGRRHCKKHRSM
jgi:competence protein ComEC